MNIAYYRKSKFDVQETVRRILDAAPKQGFSVLGQIELPRTKGKAVSLCRPEWLDRLVGAVPQVAGLLPCSIVVFEREGEVQVGMTDPAILGSLGQSAEIAEVAAAAGAAVKELVHAAAGVEALKITGIRLYSTATCPYCRAEARWLDERKVKYELVKVDEDEKEAERMVRGTGQLGVPVTEILYDEGGSEFIVGFDRARLARTLDVRS